MRQPSNSGRRSRGRPNRKPHGGNSGRSSSFESNGPEGRIRGNASQVYEKYISLARDAMSSGDRVAAETYYQHAEHYYRIVNDSTDPQHGQRPQQSGDGFQRHRNGRDHNRDHPRETERDSGRDGGRQAAGENGAGADHQAPAASNVAQDDSGQAQPPLEQPSLEQPATDQAASNPAQAAARAVAPEAEETVSGSRAPKAPRAPRGRPRKKAVAVEGESSDGDAPTKPRRTRRKPAAAQSGEGASGAENQDSSTDFADGPVAAPPNEAVNS